MLSSGRAVRGLSGRPPVSQSWEVIRHDPPKEAKVIIRLNGPETIYVDGVHPIDFRAGQEAELPERIAAVLLTEGRASLPAAAKANLIGAPENKAAIEGAAPGRRHGRKAKR